MHACNGVRCTRVIGAMALLVEECMKVASIGALPAGYECEEHHGLVCCQRCKEDAGDDEKHGGQIFGRSRLQNLVCILDHISAHQIMDCCSALARAYRRDENKVTIDKVDIDMFEVRMLFDIFWYHFVCELLSVILRDHS